MAKNNLLTVHFLGQEIGKLGFDEHRNASFFQFKPDFLKVGGCVNLFPFVIRRVGHPQVFTRFSGDTFRSLPPMIADSLPDTFGNIIFKTWLESRHSALNQISVLEQLAYVGQRGMGALEYHPSKEIPSNSTIDISEMADIAGKVLRSKADASGDGLDHRSLLNIFKIGSSVGGARAKILVSQDRKTGRIIPGDVASGNDSDHLLVKLGIDEDIPYSRELVEFTYYQAATFLGIDMMESRLIEDRHFATLRFDRLNGEKRHVLTATGLTGWDFRDARESSYENLFKLALTLKLDHRESEQLFRRMVFNVIFANHDDHLKNHSFVYDHRLDRWHLSPAYDLTYSLNPLLNFKSTPRALSVNGKRSGITMRDILTVADTFSIGNPRRIVSDIQNGRDYWIDCARKAGLPEKIVQAIRKNFETLH